jgi:multiple sugar transport system substrate-binding protein
LSKRKFVFMAVVLLITVLAMVIGTTSAAPKREITIAMMTGPEMENTRELAKEFTAQTGINVKFLPLGREAYIEQVTTQLMGKSTAVDIVSVITSLVFNQFAAGNYLEPLEPYIKKFRVDTKYLIDPVVDTVRFNGKLYGLPTDGAGMFLVYRKDLIQNPPKTWEEYIEIARKNTQALNPGAATKYGAAILGQPINIAFDFFTWLYSFGGDVIDSKGQVVLDSKQSIAAAQLYISMYQKERILPPDVNTYEWAEVNSALQQSVAAMSVQWNSGALVCMDQKQSPKVFEKIGATLVPGVKLANGTIRRTPFIQSWAFALNKYSKRKDDAFIFMKWFIQKDVLKKYALMGNTPPVKDVLTDPQVLAKYPLNELLMETFSVGRTIPKSPAYSIIRDVLSTNLSNALAGSKTPEAAMKDAAREIREVLGTN